MPIPSLPRFLYLDEKSLGEYLSVVEEGISDETKRRRLHSEPAVPPGLGEIDKGSGTEEEERMIRETSSQRFIRFVKALTEDSQRWQYYDIDSIADVFEKLKVMDLIHGHFEIEVPPLVQLMSQPEQFSSMVDMLDAMRPMASIFGGDVDGLPKQEETAAFRDFTKVVKSDMVVVGYQDDDAPKVTGKLNKEFVRDSLEGEVFILGKVARKWKKDERHSLLALPGASLMSRQQRRKVVKSSVKNNENDDAVLAGPALTLDILAIYR
ncbi:DUF6414 family protein [Streptomyces marincola]|uniref:DUF6414 family protein n=1 Tax=Streptomyces marincola TaxID=2878388 RepID=UPI001CF11F2D|nr:hypothetical protein [Streptomyces marincola]UCM89268.1 hypothetical protein LC193_15665 [Streptomyces marincola]